MLGGCWSTIAMGSLNPGTKGREEGIVLKGGLSKRETISFKIWPTTNLLKW